MPKFSANLTTMFTEVPFLDRFEQAAQAGFDAVEFQFPYDHSAADIRQRLEACGQRAVLFNAPAGDMAKGERGLACLPGREAEFREGIARAVDYAGRLGVGLVHCMAGTAPAGVPEIEIKALYIANLRHAAAALGRIDAVVTIEPLNEFDVPGYYVRRTGQAASIIDEVGAANVRVQYDLFHAARSEGKLAETLTRYLGKIGHIQIADCPGRHEPGTGATDFAFLLAHIDAIGYRGHVGCEYTPATTTEAGLGWLLPWRAARAE